MKYQLIDCFTKALLLVLVGLAIRSTALAQAPSPRHPGDVLTYIVSFDGPDAGKLTAAQVFFELPRVDPKNDQTGFTTSLRLDTTKVIGSGVFQVAVTIPTNLASGVYRLSNISAGTRDIGASYNEGLPLLNITIENPARFIKPEFKGIREVPKS